MKKKHPVHTEEKTNYWRMNHLKRLIDYFKVKDVHGILYLTVYDEDKNHKSEFLGKIAVPLLKMEVRAKYKACINIRRPNSIKAFMYVYTPTKI